MITERTIDNFNAGPAILPLDVLKKVQKDLLNYDNNGLSIFETSLRSKNLTKF